MNKFASEMFKLNITDNSDAEEDPNMEGCASPNIQEKYNLTPKISPVYYYDMLLTLEKKLG